MLARSALTASIVTLLFFVVPSAAFAGPYGPSGGINISFKKSLHMGGAFAGLFGRGQGTAANSFSGEATLEYLALDVLALGLVMRSHALPTLPQPIGDRANTVRFRLRLQVPLVGGSAHRRPVVPYASIGIDSGLGWVAGAASGTTTRVVGLGGQLRIGIILWGRVSLYVPIGYDRTILDGPDVRQFETGLGVLIRLAGRTAYGPMPTRTGSREQDEREDRGRMDRTVDTLRRLGEHSRGHHEHGSEAPDDDEEEEDDDEEEEEEAEDDD